MQLVYSYSDNKTSSCLSSRQKHQFVVGLSIRLVVIHGGAFSLVFRQRYSQQF